MLVSSSWVQQFCREFVKILNCYFFTKRSSLGKTRKCQSANHWFGKNHASDHSSYLSQIVFAHILAANVKLGEWKLYERRLTCTDGQTQLRQVENDVVHDRLYAQNNVECLLQVSAGSCRFNTFCLHFCMYMYM